MGNYHDETQWVNQKYGNQTSVSNLNIHVKGKEYMDFLDEWSRKNNCNAYVIGIYTNLHLEKFKFLRKHW